MKSKSSADQKAKGVIYVLTNIAAFIGAFIPVMFTADRAIDNDVIAFIVAVIGVFIVVSIAQASQAAYDMLHGTDYSNE